MLNVNAFFDVLNEFAPLALSHELVSKGDYDNSGIIVKCGPNIKRALFTLELSEKAVDVAKKYKCDAIITHHPAIYKPITSLSIDDVKTSALIKAISKGISVISMHLNLDVVCGGIDASLSEVLGAKKHRIIKPIDEINGYGREFSIEPITLNEFIKNAKNKLKTAKIIVYGKKTTTITSVASFCGGGASYAEKAVLSGEVSASVIVTSDMPHHVIAELVCRGKSIVIIPHYASENYGFEKYYQKVKKALNNKVETFYFEDKRFL